MLLLCRRRRALTEYLKEFTVVTPNTKSTSENVNEIPAIAQKFHEQLISTVKQGQQLSVDAAQTWAKAVSVIPAFDLPKIPGVPALPGVEAATKYTFDVAADLLNAQREFALELTSALAPAKN
jgi:hypothetical protein